MALRRSPDLILQPRALTASGERYITVRSSSIVLTRETEKNRRDCTLLISSWLSLLSDSPISGNKKPLRVYLHFLDWMCNDLKKVVITLSDLAHTLVSQHMGMGTVSSIGDWIPDFKNTPVFFEYNRYHDTGDPSLLKYLYTFLNFGKKFEFDDEEFHSTAFRGWMDIENGLKNLEFSSIDIASLRNIIERVLPDPSPSDFWPKHGPGAVSERGIRSIHDKHSAIAYHEAINSFLSSFDDENFRPSLIIPNDWGKPETEKPLSASTLRFVPKSMKVARSICMEPATNMFFQQGLKAQMYKSIEVGPLGRFVRLKDQSFNQSLAMYGSYTYEIDTIDLSSASDSVHIDLVKGIFPQAWLNGMLATRSSKVRLPDNSLHDLVKFAPMGSALCFPVQCVIFASVCIYASHLYRKALPYDYQELVQASDVDKAIWLYRHHTFAYEHEGLYLQPLGVYGDDICCDRRITAYIKSILYRLGFKINEGKSFTQAQSFRESCGIFCLDGADITPLYFRVRGAPRPEGSRKRLPFGPEFLSAMVHTINEARKHLFRCLYRFLIHTLRSFSGKSYPFKIPWVSEKSTEFGIVSSNSESPNSHLVKRFNSDLQRDEYDVWSISFKDRYHGDEDRHESYLYMRWWAKRYDYSSYQLIAGNSHTPTAGSRIKRRWTPLY